MTLRSVEVEPGVALRVRDVGAGPPVVFIAGWGFSHDVWDAQIRVAARSRRVIGIDQRGHGGSDAPSEGYGLERLAADVVEVLEQLRVADAVLVGWSLGGMVAMRVAAERRDLVGRLVLVGSNGVRASRSDAYPFGPDAHEHLPALVRGEEGARPRFRRRMIGAGFHRPADDELLDWLVRDSLHTPSWSGIACFETLFLSDQTASLVGLRDLDVVHIAGTDDGICPLEGAEWLAERLERLRRVEISACGHYPMFEHPDEFAASLADALEPS